PSFPYPTLFRSERLLALVVRHDASSPALPDGVDLVDEDDRWRAFARAGEQIAHARGTESHEQLDEARTGHREEGNAGLAGHRPGQERLAGSGRSDHQHAPGADRADTRVPFGVLQEVH